MNDYKTQIVQSDSKYIAYNNWLSENGCIAPSIEFPVAFGADGVVGARARAHIPPNKAFLYVPYTITLNVVGAKNSEIGFIFESYPEIFRTHSDASDNILWVFLVYERCKGARSFWHPYFETTSETNLLFDWSDLELEELQDDILVFDCEKWAQKLLGTWELLKGVFEAYPEFFPPEMPLKTLLDWAWKLSSTRSFAWEGGMIIPFADNLNHSDLYIRYDCARKSQIEYNIGGSTDYSDFSNTLPESPEVIVPKLGSRLEKYRERMQQVCPVDNIWELETHFKGLKSDSDDESVRNYGDVPSEDEDDEEAKEEELKSPEEMANYYFIMSTGTRTAFLKGNQAFNAYGRLSNRELLLDYGFALLENKYEAYYFRMWDLSTGRSGLVLPSEVRSQAYKKEFNAILDDITEFFTLKLKKMNYHILTYYRKLNNHDVVIPSNLDVELSIVEEVISLYLSLQKSPIEHDEMLLNQNHPPRVKTAIIYRYSQKRILNKQIEFLNLLKQILIETKSGVPLSKHLRDKNPEDVEKCYPLMGYLKILNNCF